MTRSYFAIDKLQQITTTPGVTSLGLNASTTLRPAVTEMIVSTLGLGQDKMIHWELRRFDTSVGTGTALTEFPVDPEDAGALKSAALGNHSSEPTYGSLAIPLSIGVHQRNFLHWRAAQNRGIPIPAVATEGLGVVPFHADSTVLVATTLYWEE